MNGGPEAEAIARLVEDVRARRASGENLTDEAVLAANPQLAARLSGELRKLGMIQKARRLAGALEHARTISLSEFVEGRAQLAADAIAGYEIIREIHRGSQGVVYLAIQKSTRRETAIKVMKQGLLTEPYDRMRFEREVQVLSALKHPNIVSIHDSGEAGGLSYFVMNYVEGEPLDTYVSRAGCGIDAILRLFVKICEAVSAAQVCGVIHRDLKPGNIRIDRSGEPHVLDFGLAKIDARMALAAAQDVHTTSRSGGLVQHAAETFTQAGQFVGSLPWASPEQAEGSAGAVDLRTDVYSLGVILFQVLTGLFPYSVSGSIRTVLDNIQNAAPIRPSAVRREINDEIETIVLKCLQKDRERRYQSAGDLSRDVQRYLHGEPIDAKRDSRWYVLRKRLQRNRLAVAAILAVFASLIAGIISTTRATWRAQRAEADARASAQTESRMREQADWLAYKACLAAADAALAANNTAGARARLDAAPPALRGWEWRYLFSRLDQSLSSYRVPGAAAARFVLSPDRRTAYVALTDGHVIALDPLTGDARELAVRLPGAANSLALSRDGQHLAIGLPSGAVCVCDPQHGRELHRFPAHAAGPISALAFSPDGRTLASAGALAEGRGDSIRLWDVESAAARGVIETSNAWVNTLAFRPDGRVLASGHTKVTAGFRLWDLETSREILTVDYEGLDVNQLAFSPNGNMLAVASQDSAIRLYDAVGRELRTLSGHTAGIEHVAFSTDGARLASASIDQTVRVWDLKSGATTACRRGHLNTVKQVGFVGDEERLLSLSLAESAFKLWNVAQAEEPPTFETGKYFVLSLAYSQDGRRLYTHQRCWDAAAGRLLARLPARPGWQTNMWVGAGESLEWAIDGADPANAALLRNGTPLLQTKEPLLFRLVVSANGAHGALALRRGVIKLLRLEDGGEIGEIPIDAKTATGASFSHDGESLLIWDSQGRWSVWDVGSAREKLRGTHGSEQLVNAVFSRDARLLATASYDGAARIWDASSGGVLQVLRPSDAPTGDQSVMWSVEFSPDGARLATGSKDRRIRLWDVASGQELMSLTRHAGTVMCLAWSPDGTQLASGGFDGTVCLWDACSQAERHAAANRGSANGATP